MDRTASSSRRICWASIFLFLGTLGLLSLNLDSPYTRRHEDNNALYSTFARAHLRLGLAETKAHDTFVSRESGAKSYYAHHPPGVALTLALAFWVTGSDSPAVVRSVAVLFSMISLLLFYRLCMRFSSSRSALLAALLFAVLPIFSFYGRMANHEPLALPFSILLIDGYVAYLLTGRRSQLAKLVAATALGSLMGWVIFFPLGACWLHALWLSLRSCVRARSIGILLALAAVLWGSLILLHLLLVTGGDLSDLRRIFLERLGAGKEYGPVAWTVRMLDYGRRLLSGSGVIASIWVAWRTFRALLRHESPELEEQVASIFLLGGVSYVVLFNWGAWQHHYWQLPLLPGVAIALGMALRRLNPWTKPRSARTIPMIALFFLVVAEIGLSTGTSLLKLHRRDDAFVLKRVAELESQHL